MTAVVITLSISNTTIIQLIVIHSITVMLQNSQTHCQTHWHHSTA